MARFRFATDRARYALRRHALRTLLGQHLGIAAAEVPLRLGEHNKPELSMAGGPHFNMSHHGDYTLIVLCDEVEVGVDLEGDRSWPDLDALATMNFSPAEWAAYQALDVGRREAAFLNVWTRKEACLKAVGTGLAIDLRDLHTGLETDTRMVRVPTAVGERHVLLSSFNGPAGLKIAIATGR